MIVVTHDEHAALSYADKVIEMKDGQILSQKDMREGVFHKLSLRDADKNEKKEFASRSIREVSNQLFEFLSNNLCRKYEVEYSVVGDDILELEKVQSDNLPLIKKYIKRRC